MYAPLLEVARKRAEADAPRPLLSIYLDVDQSEQINLNRGFETPLKNMLRELRDQCSEGQQSAFDADAEQVTQFVEDYTPSNGARGLGLIADAGEGLLFHATTQTPVDNVARWRPWPHLRPLAAAESMTPHGALVVADREKARIFAVEADKLAHEVCLVAEEETAQFDATGRDNLPSQMTHQHRTEHHLGEHLQRVANAVDDFNAENPFVCLVIGGPDDVRQRLEELLSQEQREKIIGHSHASPQEAETRGLEDCQQAVDTHVRQQMDELVENVITISAKEGKAVARIQPVVEACIQGRVESLVYSDDPNTGPPPCTQATKMVNEAAEVAGKDSPIQRPEELLDWAITTVLARGGRVVPLHDEPAQRLHREAGGIGALLW